MFINPKRKQYRKAIGKDEHNEYDDNKEKGFINNEMTRCVLLEEFNIMMNKYEESGEVSHDTILDMCDDFMKIVYYGNDEKLIEYPKNKLLFGITMRLKRD